MYHADNFGFSVPSDVYSSFTVQGSKWLKRQIPMQNDDISTLTGGDANGDNSVDSTDFGLLIGAYGSSSAVANSGYIVGADFNCDGLVDSTDFGILIGSYGAMGAP